MKRLLTFVGCVGMALASNADLLFWQVSADALDNVEATTYSYAKIYFSSSNPPDTTGGAKVNYLDQDMSIELGDSVYKTTLDSISGAYASIGDFNSATANAFAIELYNASNEAIANSGWITENIADYIVSTAEFNSNWSAMTQSAGLGASTGAWSAGAVPEPTSGLMLLVGMAMLGLRRRKVA